MIRTVLTIGLFAVLGLFLLKIAFGVLGFALGLFLALLKMALMVAIVGFCIYLIVRVVSPDTARRLRERWSGRAI